VRGTISLSIPESTLVGEAATTRIGRQLATVRCLNEPVPTHLDCVGRERLNGVEFGGLDGTDLEDAGTALDRTGLEAAVVQVALDRFEGEYETITDRYRQLGCHRRLS
jgi:hypothetical protein